MLCTLQIENYALIRSLNIDFKDGFTVITGETGAGKSILLGALSLILGSRADTDVLHDKNKKCIVEGTFDLTSLQLSDFFEQNDIDYSLLTTLRREINEHGRSRAFINDTPVTLNTLRQLAASLIDIHSQHQNLLLQDSKFRLNLVDQFAKNQTILANYKEKLQLFKQTELRYQQLKQQCAEEARKQEYILFTIQELNNAQLQPNELEQTEQLVKILSHAEEIKSHLFNAGQLLSEQEGNTIIQLLQEVESECQHLQHLGKDFQEINSRLGSVILELKDLSYDIVRQSNEIEVNPKELEQLNARLDTIYALQHKYQVENISELLDLANSLKQEIDQYSDHQEELLQLEQLRSSRMEEATACAHQLSESRLKIASTFQQRIEQQLQLLGMPDSRFQILFSTKEELHPEGIDDISFNFSANQGIAPTELSKIASGGEMSRVMLALKSIITDSALLPTVIFDEVDTGISGETANKVALVMGTLSEKHQVIAISHLPQIAARGDQQYLVYKETIEGTAQTNLRLLSYNERILSIASILGGTRATASAQTTAQELLSSFHPKETKN